MKSALACFVFSSPLLFAACASPDSAQSRAVTAQADRRIDQVQTILPAVASAYSEAQSYKAALRAAEGRGDNAAAQRAAVRIATILLAFPPAELDDEAIDMLRAAREHANRVDIALGGRIKACIDELCNYQTDPGARFSERVKLREIQVAGTESSGATPPIVEAGGSMDDQGTVVEAGSSPPGAPQDEPAPVTEPESTTPKANETAESEGPTSEPEADEPESQRVRREKRLRETRRDEVLGQLDEDLARADLLFKRGKFLEARDIYLAALAKYLGISPNDPKVRDVRTRLGNTYFALGDPGAARGMFDEVVQSDESNESVDGDAKGAAAAARGRTAEAQGDLLAAQRDYFRALQHFGFAGTRGSAPSAATELALENVSTALADQADVSESKGDSQSADETRAEIANTFRTLQLGSPIRIRVLTSRTRAAQRRCDLSAAITLQREIVDVLAARDDVDLETLAEARRDLAAFLRVSSDLDGARAVEELLRR